jgi:hypothetical protein
MSCTRTAKVPVTGSARGETRGRIAYSPPSESPLTAEHQATLLPDGTLEGSLFLRGKGAVDGRLRGFVSGVRARDLGDACAAMLSAVSPAVEITGLCETPGGVAVVGRTGGVTSDGAEAAKVLNAAQGVYAGGRLDGYILLLEKP